MKSLLEGHPNDHTQIAQKQVEVWLVQCIKKSVLMRHSVEVGVHGLRLLSLPVLADLRVSLHATIVLLDFIMIFPLEVLNNVLVK